MHSVSGREWSCHRLPAVSGCIVSVGGSGVVIVCLLFQGGYISVSGSEGGVIVCLLFQGA